MLPSLRWKFSVSLTLSNPSSVLPEGLAAPDPGTVWYGIKLLSSVTNVFHRYGKITVSGDGLYRAEEDKPAYFYIDTHGMDGTPEVRVEGGW